MDRLDRAWLLIEQRRYELAAEEATEAVRADPEDCGGYYVLSEALQLLERWDDAERAARTAISKAPDWPHGYLTLARVQVARGKTKDALKTLGVAGGFAADDPDYWALLSHTQTRREQAKAALDSARQGLALDPDHDDCRENEAIALINLRRVDEADQALLASLRKNPNSSMNHHLRGAALLATSRPKDALGHYEAALRLDPTDEDARKGVGDAWRMRSRVYVVMHDLAGYVRAPISRLWMYAGLGVGGLIAHFRRAEGLAGDEGGITLAGTLLFFSFPDILGWLSLPLFTLPLLPRQRARQFLTSDEIRAALVAGGWSIYAVVCIGAAIYQRDTMPLWGAFVATFAAVPCVVVFECRPGWPRHLMACYSISLAGFALYGVHLASDNESLLESVRYACLAGVPVAGWLGSLLSKHK